MFIVFTGGVLGIITMRFVVRYFIVALDRFPGLAEGAYFLVAWIGLKLVLSGLETGEYPVYTIPEWLFWSVMLGIVVISLLAKPRPKSPEMIQGLQLLDEEEGLLGEESRNGAVGTDHGERVDAPADDAGDVTPGHAG